MELWNAYSEDIKKDILITIDDKYKNHINNLLKKDFDKFTKNDWKILKEAGIVNGVWPSYFSRFLRFVISLIFFTVDYKRHDVNYFIWGTEKDRKKADDGLLKYSILSIYIIFNSLKFTNILVIDLFLFVFYFWLWNIYLLVVTPLLVIVIFSYLAVRLFGGSSFYYVNDKAWLKK